MFENKVIRGIFISRYIASWVKVGGSLEGDRFVEWLRQLVINGEHLSENEIKEIRNFATDGKLELECNARSFGTR